jgi:uncharacterized protein with PQ loop repeat
MNPTVMTLLLVLANVMGAGMIVPQVVRLHRVRSADGVSGVWIGVGIAMNSWWIAYGLAESLWGILPVSIAAAALYLVMAGQYLGLLGRPGLRPLVTGLFLLGLVPMPFLAVGGWSIAGLVVGLAYAIQFSPAAFATLRSNELSGVSTVTWSMAWVEAVIWVIYGLSTGDAALLVGGTGGTLAATVILVRLAFVRRRPPGTETPGSHGEHDLPAGQTTA